MGAVRAVSAGHGVLPAALDLAGVRGPPAGLAAPADQCAPDGRRGPLTPARQHRLLPAGLARLLQRLLLPLLRLRTAQLRQRGGQHFHHGPISGRRLPHLRAAGAVLLLRPLRQPRQPDDRDVPQAH